METYIKKVIRKVEKFNADLEAYAKVAGDYELPETECSIEGFSEVGKYTYEVSGNETSILVKDGDGNEFDIYDDECVAYDEYEEAIKYDRRRLGMAWRIWKSENPDAELEKDDEE